jgi:bifunctional UDP-N-acetylglucosamine pyrophosphorylase/glucosamine-1-phosphate N-acetyltransferase
LKELAVIVLAAGLGTRMKSSLAKVLHPLAGRPMLLHTLDNVLAIKPEKTVTVLGHQAERASAILPDGITIALQKDQLGTAHAALAGLEKLGGFEGMLLLVSGDTPLLGPDTLKGFIGTHEMAGAAVSILTAHLDDPTGYGRIVRDGWGNVVRIVEEKDATPEEKALKEINTGTYCFDIKALESALQKVRADNAQNEFYLTDVVAIANDDGEKVVAVPAGNPEEALGINSRSDLARADRIIRLRINERLMAAGVGMIDPDTTYIDGSVSIGRDTVVYPGNHITGDTTIGEGCTLMPGCIIDKSTIGDGVKIKPYSVLDRAIIEQGAAIGPFAHLRPGSVVGTDARVGNFVELKKTVLGRGTKASHLSYLGDSVIGDDVNIGAGTITCNYDGYNKFQTVIGDGTFVGSDTQFVAPVTVGKGAVIAAGTTVTKDVPDDALAISRSPQTNKNGWAGKNRQIKGTKT